MSRDRYQTMGLTDIGGEICLITTDDLTVDGKRVADDWLAHL